ncbi:phage tail protein, partial [Shigella flexneri]|nr:phage tail protein [Shigella flexneri]EFW0021484.1 phage tail protein [Shigella flexneri]EFY0106114.1 phage tail protein [Shigella flexneri]
RGCSRKRTADGAGCGGSRNGP